MVPHDQADTVMLYEVYTINLTNQVYNVGVMMASKSKFDALKDAQEAIRAASINLTKDWRTTIAAKSDEIAARYRIKGMTAPRSTASIWHSGQSW